MHRGTRQNGSEENLVIGEFCNLVNENLRLKPLRFEIIRLPSLT